MAIKILLAEDQAIVREGLKVLLDSEPEVSVVAVASNGREVLETIEKIEVDIVIMEVNMPVMNGLTCTKQVKAKFPDIRVLILSVCDNESYLIDLLDAGADGYILKSSTKEELLFAIHKISNDGTYIGPEFTLNILNRRKAERKTDSAEINPNNTLTDREMEVLELIAQGMTNAEMASKLFISVRTIETRRKKILEKTGTTNTATLIKYAILNGLIR